VKEIPRLIIGYVFIIATFFSVFLRISLHFLSRFLYRYNCLEKETILIIGNKDDKDTFESDDFSDYIHSIPSEREKIEGLIRSKNISRILLFSATDEKFREDIIHLCAIYGIPFSYPKILREVSGISIKESFVAGFPVMEVRALRIGAWGRILKRTLDIILSLFGLILLSPIFIIIAIAIWVEDQSGPVIFRNRRVGYSGKEFFLYKFRYMYWKYSVKDAYGIIEKDDTALAYEEELKKASDTRSGPLYKIASDPRKSRVGSIIERLSLDELPQLWNVFIGNMSLV
jgi:lipopolysaccharide/colanic/teichoic acid biosynthesis glycosyltransferase